MMMRLSRRLHPPPAHHALRASTRPALILSSLPTNLSISGGASTSFPRALVVARASIASPLSTEGTRSDAVNE
jgi:hypothetical protein